MTMTLFLMLLLMFLVVHVSASDFALLEPMMDLEGSSAPFTAQATSLIENHPEMTLATIDKALPTSMTFQLVNNTLCNATVSEKLYLFYDNNPTLFDRCVIDAQYQIFPFLGTKPSAAQIKSMSLSMPCVAMFTGVLLANLPQCSISGFPLKAAVETLLKIHVDLVQGWAPSPTAKRFQEMLTWRQDVNLANEAGLPCDSNSRLYAEYDENLSIVQRNSSIRVLPDYHIEYKLDSGSWYDDDVDSNTNVKDGGRTFDTVAAGNVGKQPTIANNCALTIHGVMAILVSVLLSIFVMPY